MLDQGRPWGPREIIGGRGAIGWAEEGMALTRRGDLLGALKCLERSLECDANCYEAWLGLSEVFMVMRDAERADRCLQVARRLRARGSRRPIVTATA